MVDDGSEDKTREIVSNLPVKYIYQDNAGPAKARNRGWKNSGGEIVFFLDSDCVPEESWIPRTLLHYNNPDVASVGTCYGIANTESLLARCIHAEFLVRYSKMPLEVKFTGSGTSSFRRTALEEVGGYDEEFATSSGEDNDLCFRLIRRGYKIIHDRKIVVGHFFPEKLLYYLQTQYWHGYWRVKLYKTHPGMMRGENYATALDFVQPPLMLIGTFLIPFVVLRPVMTFLVVLIFLVGILLQFPYSIAIARRGKWREALFYVILGFTRAIFRGWGMFIGISRFWIRDAITQQNNSG